MRNTSMAQRVRRMILSGHSNQAIIEKLHVKPQVVYNIRYKLGKKKGLGALPLVATPQQVQVAEPQVPEPSVWHKVVRFFTSWRK
jgi:hypothetical protein